MCFLEVYSQVCMCFGHTYVLCFVCMGSEVPYRGCLSLKLVYASKHQLQVVTVAVAGRIFTMLPCHWGCQLSDVQYALANSNTVHFHTDKHSWHGACAYFTA